MLHFKVLLVKGGFSHISVRIRTIPHQKRGKIFKIFKTPQHLQSSVSYLKHTCLCAFAIPSITICHTSFGDHIHKKRDLQILNVKVSSCFNFNYSLAYLMTIAFVKVNLFDIIPTKTEHLESAYLHQIT